MRALKWSRRHASWLFWGERISATSPIDAVWGGRVHVRMRPLAAVFDARLNGLNLIRLLLATGVLLHHSFQLLGVLPASRAAEELMRAVFVDGFFAISGFLIVDSWMRRPDWRLFLRARFVRILPAFWVCLIATAVVFAPSYALLTGRPITPAFLSDAASYVWRNALLWMFQDGIAGTPDAPTTSSALWNGSLWTLAWEFLCYLGVLALGVTALIRRRFVFVGLFAAALVVLATARTVMPNVYLLHSGARFAVMFLAGALIYQFRDRIPVHPLLVVGAAAVVVVSATGWLPSYRLVAALPLAYLCLAGGALIKVPALRLRDDFSYGIYIYGFPVQQMLLVVGTAGGGVAGFFALSALAVLPLAAASWFFIEKPAQRLRAPRRAPSHALVETAPGSQPV